MSNTPVLNSSSVATDFRNTPTGPIALIGGQWYSVNGTAELVTDIRFRVDSPTHKAPVSLNVYSQPEVYAGSPTGNTVWRAESVNTGTYQPFASVLGRGDTRTEAIADWNRRALVDGHSVNGQA